MEISVKQCIKSLLISIILTKNLDYVHGDIKEDNFIYRDGKFYYLIDFENSGEALTELNTQQQFLILLQKRINTVIYIKIIDTKKAVYGL